jgi:DNA-binding transcriptional MerR regulator
MTADGWTIDELARTFELPVSTLRMYQHRGLLPAPERRGRVAYYGDEHANRLRMLVALQERGFSLAAIKELLDGWEEGRSLDEVLGLAGGAGDVWAPEEPVVVEPAELAGRFPEGTITPELIRRAAASGMVRFTDDGRIELATGRYLDIGTRLVELGIPAADVIDEYAHLRSACDDLAGRFTELFRRHLWDEVPPADRVVELGIPAADVIDEYAHLRSACDDLAGRFTELFRRHLWDEVPPADRVIELSRSLGELGPLALAIVDATLRHALQDAARRFLDEQADVLAAPGPGAD